MSIRRKLSISTTLSLMKFSLRIGRRDGLQRERRNMRKLKLPGARSKNWNWIRGLPFMISILFWNLFSFKKQSSIEKSSMLIKIFRRKKLPSNNWYKNMHKILGKVGQLFFKPWVKQNLIAINTFKLEIIWHC